MTKKRIPSADVLRYLCLLLVVAFGFATIIATGGGGGGGSGGSTTPATTSSRGTGSGSVAVLIADGPADGYQSIWVSITKVSLIPPEGSGRDPVVVFQSRSRGGCKVDLLEYRDEDFLLTLNDRVQAGLYSKVRLEVAEIRSKGGSCDDQWIKLPSNKIDLNPQGPIEVKSGEALAVRLDIDANKSMNLHVAGNSGKCMFRPVVFVDIETVELQQRCPLIVIGEVLQVFDQNQDEIVEGFKIQLDGDRGPLIVRLLRHTVVFDEDGFPLKSYATTDDLKEGDMVWVRGRLDEYGKLNASEVVIGRVLTLNGTAQDSPDTDGVFSLFLDEGEPFTDDSVNVKVFEGDSLILFGCDTVATLSDIRRGVRAKVVGKYSGTEDVLRAAVVFLKPEEITGEIVSIMDAEGGKDLTIRQAEDGEVTVFLPADTPIKLRGDGQVPLRLLCEGRMVRVILDPDKLLTAQKIEVEEDILEGEVTAVNDLESTIFVDGQRVFVTAFATIMDQRGEEDTLVDFDQIIPGSMVRCFGLDPCPGDVEFHAFVILIPEDET